MTAMMQPPGQTLFDLLPALHKLRDTSLAPITLDQALELRGLEASVPTLDSDGELRLAFLRGQARGPLQCLLMVLDEQLAVLADDLNQLYDDQFIETCAPWVIPYLGDLIGYEPVHGVATAIATPRAEVAHTISLRRRKGNLLTLEQLARDVTGWGAHVVEQFKTLATTQSMKHLRLSNHGAADLRRPQTAAYLNTPFDRTSYTVDVRSVALQRGRHNLQDVAVFLWSLKAHTLTRATAAAADTTGQLFRFNPLGADIPLFTNAVSQGSTVTVAALPHNVPARLRRRILCQDNQSQSGPTYYGEGNSLAVYRDGVLLNAYDVQVCTLAGTDGAWSNTPPLGSVFAAAIDPELGRIALPPPAAGEAKPVVRVSFCQGFAADLGGGEYPRSDSFAVEDPASVRPVPDVAYATLQDAFKFVATHMLPFPDTMVPARYTSLQEARAFAAANSMIAPGQLAFEIADSQTYLSASFVVAVPGGCTIELRAADGHRPTVLLSGEMMVTGGLGSSFQLNGLQIALAPGVALPASLIHAPDDGVSQLGRLSLVHCTLVPGLSLLSDGKAAYPGHVSLLADLPGLQLTINRSILGGVQVASLGTASISNSILDANDPEAAVYSAPDGLSGGGGLTLTACTVIGKLHAALFTLISNSIVHAALAAHDTWQAPVWSDRRQQGCVRFTALPSGSILPRQFECVEPLNGIEPVLFRSLRFSSPGYAQLLPETCDTIRRGAEDSGEMGAFHSVMAPMRETDLRVRLQEYLPAGLQFGIYYEN